jgi:hypothetical protein
MLKSLKIRIRVKFSQASWLTSVILATQRADIRRIEFGARPGKQLSDPISANKKLGITEQGWLMPVILATREAEIRKIEVQTQPWQIVRETLSQKTLHTKGLVSGSKCRL